MALPLVLAGPILRRVESNLVSVWIALSRSANVTITLWEGRIKPGAAGEFFRSNPPTPTLRIADNLHVTVALARIPAGSQKVFKPGVIYSYDLTIVAGANTHTLASLGLLKNIPTANGGPAGSERPHLALGYKEDFLPSFALPPDEARGSAHRLRLLPPSGERASRRDGDDRRSHHRRPAKAVVRRCVEAAAPAGARRRPDLCGRCVGRTYADAQSAGE